MKIKSQKILWIGFFLLNLLVIFFYWWQGSGDTLFSGVAGFLVAFGRLAGLLAAFTVLTQFFFMGRTPWLEKIFGLDKLSVIHRKNGKASFYLLLSHPLLITLGYAKRSNTDFYSQLKILIFNYPYVIWAAVSFVLFILVIVSSIYIVRKKLRYESWYFVHLAVYLAIFGSLWHQFALGHDLLISRIFYTYWIILYAFVFGNHLLFRFSLPIYRFFKHRFFVEKIVRENHNTVSVYITGKKISQFPVRPGQFMIFRFFRKGMWWQAHPFSLSRIPDGKYIRITVKELGDFTRDVKNIPAGTRVFVDGPYGVFTDFFCLSPSVLLIAGGIGITPIRSLAEKLLLQGKKVTLLYANKTQKDIVFKRELEDLARKYPLQLTHILSEEKEYEGEKGYLDKDSIFRLVPDVREREMYICGPPPMMDALIAAFKDFGFPKNRLHFEKFSL